MIKEYLEARKYLAMKEIFEIRKGLSSHQGQNGSNKKTIEQFQTHSIPKLVFVRNQTHLPVYNQKRFFFYLLKTRVKPFSPTYFHLQEGVSNLLALQAR